MVLRKGRSKALKTSMPSGGQTPPVCSTRMNCFTSSGNRLASKKAQKKAAKNIHLGCDEKRHAIAQAKLHNRRVVPLEGGLPGPHRATKST